MEVTVKRGGIWPIASPIDVAGLEVCQTELLARLLVKAGRGHGQTKCSTACRTLTTSSRPPRGLPGIHGALWWRLRGPRTSS